MNPNPIKMIVATIVARSAIAAFSFASRPSVTVANVAAASTGLIMTSRVTNS